MHSGSLFNGLSLLMKILRDMIGETVVLLQENFGLMPRGSSLEILLLSIDYSKWSSQSCASGNLWYN
jgi:hypothetical protein